jgi:hypothetical protein
MEMLIPRNALNMINSIPVLAKLETKMSKPSSNNIRYRARNKQSTATCKPAGVLSNKSREL